ncbi:MULTISPECIES: DNA-directed DNA polymerase II small subunit [Haloferax]|uniref:DNA polymerase II small subunit n=1 Tax=Haloferax marinum TaxID=2666143 RepID=A0A6A8G6T9_9EURY|nr:MULTISPECIES: DNA-directed DNA polymerase II small subunit [Haloferax]KAB1197707.1 DNA-directed DNA polymerase II small subunit [Haloferax sp. CBA1150]MRW96761.1 DNA-directed DNA polymerase II small subunit [Haloferax marinum]
MPLETPARIVRALVSRGYNAEREAVTLIAGSEEPGVTLARVVDSVPDDTLRITTDHVRAVLASAPAADPPGTESPTDSVTTDPSVSAATPGDVDEHVSESTPPETEGVTNGRNTDRSLRSLEIANDMTGQSTGTGEYDDFVKVFRDRYEKLSKMLRGRVNHRPAKAISKMSGGEDAELIGLVDDVRSTKSGHWIIDLEDTTGTFPCLVMKDKDIASYVDELLLDECIAVQGTLSGDAGILFVDSMHFPDVPRGHRPNTADRHVQAALISDVHVGSQEFMEGAWNRFAEWLHTAEAENIEYLLIAGDMVEGVGVYPNQDEELDVIDIYDQYRAFSEHLKSVPGDLDIVMIPGNHDAVRLAEPQPGFDDNLRDIMSAHDATITSNPSMVTLEGVNILMYHGVSLDEVIAELPAEKASYDEPHKAMYQLLKKRHVAPQFGGHTRLAPEKLDYLVMEDVPDIFHTGHVHKLGWGKYHNVLAVNSGCWQSQTDFQKSVNIDPDSGYAPIVDLDTLDMTVRKFS